ncbi:hypothetical protein Tco_0476449, partial [Tanacetum coccineum]
DPSLGSTPSIMGKLNYSRTTSEVTKVNLTTYMLNVIEQSKKSPFRSPKKKRKKKQKNRAKPKTKPHASNISGAKLAGIQGETQTKRPP